ncbi:MAG: LD-carboxypeptidase [Lentisphaerota bacterium]
MIFFPANIKKIAFVALSGPPDIGKVKLGTSFLESNGYEVIIKDSVFKRCSFSYLASDISTRVSDIHSCWKDTSIDLIIAVRGGYGSAQILPYIDWNILSKRRVPFIGYSDLTAFHLGMCAKGVGAAISGPMIQNYQTIKDDSFSLTSLKNIFNKQQTIYQAPHKKGFIVLKNGLTEGQIYPVTLSVLATLIGTQWMPDMNGAILLLEDINEPIYKLDRYFTQLEHTGGLNKISGLLLGNFTKCGSSRERLNFFKNIAEKIAGPVVINIPFGHAYPRISVAFESICKIDASAEKANIILYNQ